MTDLTTLQAVKDLAEVSSVKDDSLIQALITAFSDYVSQRTGIADFGAIDGYDEAYDGSGTFRMYLRQAPIVAVTLVQVNLTTLQSSAGIGQCGYVIDLNKCSLSLRFGVFCKGIQNVRVTYTAGYQAVPAGLEWAVREACATIYKRKEHLDQMMKQLGAGGGTIRYWDRALAPQLERMIMQYQRVAVV